MTGTSRPARPGVLTLGLLLLLALTLHPASSRAAVAREISDPDDLLTGPLAEGRTGDYLLACDMAAFVIAAPDHALPPAPSGGTVIDAATLPARVDALELAAALVQDTPVYAVYDQLVIINDGAYGTAVIEARGAAAGEPDALVRTRYSVEDGSTHVLMRTVIRNVGSEAVQCAAGDALHWGDATPFVPGYGAGVSGLQTISEWTAAQGDSTCLGYARPSGTVAAGHGDDWTDTTVAAGALAPGDSLVIERALVVASPDVAAVSDRIHEIRGLPTGTVNGHVVDAEDGGGVRDAVIDCSINAIATYTQVESDSAGAFSLTLPQANFEFAGAAPDYYPAETTLYVVAGMTSDLELEMMPAATSEGRGDTLTVVMRPILSVPAIATPDESFAIEAIAPTGTAGWSATLRRGGLEFDTPVHDATYEPDHERWFMSARVPAGTPEAVYDLIVEASGGIADTVAHAVSVRDSIADDFYFIQVTDTHLPTHRYHYQHGAEGDSSEMEDFRAVIDDANIINPAFVLHTGDLVNEGELEDYLGWRVYTKAHRIMRELDVPVFLVGGNHDLGGWNGTLPPQGTARRDWWSFFGWRYLADPPPGDGLYTQNYSFDYAGAHFTGLEAYNNYDSWRYDTYGSDSFTDLQLEWLLDDLASTSPDMARILFYHIDFQWQLDIEDLGVDCALWGHIHNNWGSITEHPYDLGTESCCDGNRAFRLVRVRGNTVIPEETLNAGEDGEVLRVAYSPSNDGAAATVTAVVTNEYDQAFEHAVLRFVVPSDSLPYLTDNGSITQTVVDGPVATVTVALPLAAASSDTATVYPDPDPPAPAVARASLNRPFPNPARAGATLSYLLPSRVDVRLSVYDVAGRRVVDLVDGQRDGGEHVAHWDLRDATGDEVASGIYFVRLDAGGQTARRKLVVIR